ncbi:hypothetical protein ACFQ1M_02660 [Sungkyunkwania multivorans]|uniref:Uncharacterized protein n=1 Tax=Sungkyunkwania multivorans TaxID=1173618 RepID=A0ABW3CVK5_9FLAO
MKISKIVGIIAIILSVIGVIFFLMIANGGEESSMIGPMLQLGYIMIAMAAIAAIFFGLKAAISGGNIKKTLISLVGLIVIVGLGYGLSDVSTDLIQEFANRKQPIIVEESTSKYVGTGLYVFYIFALIAIGSIIWGGIRKILIK